MPKAIARIGREKRLRTLVQNLFVIEEDDKAAAVRRAEDAVLRENPRLGTAEGFESGAVVRVPSDIGLATTARVEQPTAELSGVLEHALEHALQGLQMSQGLVLDGVAASGEDARAALARLEDEAFKGAVQETAPEAAGLIPQAINGLNERLAENERRQAALGKAIGDAIAEIDRLRQLAPGSR